ISAKTVLPAGVFCTDVVLTRRKPEQTILPAVVCGSGNGSDAEGRLPLVILQFHGADLHALNGPSLRICDPATYDGTWHKINDDEWRPSGVHRKRSHPAWKRAPLRIGEVPFAGSL